MLDFSEPSSSGRSAVLAVGRQQGLGLDRVAERGAGAVRLDDVHVRRGQTGVGQRLPDHPLLRGPFGAVRPLDAPSWLTAVPRTTASTWWPLRRASDSRSSTTQADALAPARAVGRVGERLAAAVGRQAALTANSMNSPASPSPSRRRRAPASTRRVRSACAARCSATSDDEHAVSTVTAGPSRPSA